MLAFGLIYGTTYLTAVFSATLLHELGHVAAIYMSKGSISEFELIPFGAVIRKESTSISYKNDLVISFAGPFLNIVSFGICAAIGRLGYFAAASLILATLNLIPAEPLDGYSALKALTLIFLQPEKAQRICTCVSLSVLCVLWIGAVYLTVYAGLNVYLLIMLSALIFGAVTRIK